MADGPLFSYRKRVGLGEFKFDPGQELLAEKLQNLHHSLKGYKPDAGQNGWRERLGLASRRIDPLLGLYIYGGVGAGKSMLMDLFFDGAPVVHKRRVHFHDFLQDVHTRFNVLRNSKSLTWVIQFLSSLKSALTNRGFYVLMNFRFIISLMR